MDKNATPLAQKYRPNLIGDVVGQPTALVFIRNNVRKEKARHVIFHGPSGAGKTMMASLYSRYLMCVGPVGGELCGECSSCSQFTETGRHIDLTEHDCANSSGVADIRDLVQNMRYRPLAARRMVFKLDEVHNLKRAAFDPLLVPLENKQSTAVFVLMTTELDDIPPKIRSRCVEVEVNPLDQRTAVNFLDSVCRRENVSADADGLVLLAEVSGGNARMLLNHLEEVIDNCGQVTESNVRQVLRLDYADKIVGVVKSLLVRDVQSAINVLEGWADDPARKSEAIFDFLVFLFKADLGIRTSTSVFKLRGEELNDLLNGIRLRQRQFDMGAAAFGSEMTKFWQRDRPRTDTELHLRLIQFSEWINTVTPLAPAKSAAQTRGFRPALPRNACAARVAGRSAYLSKEQLGKIWDAASFMIQVYGQFLNGRIAIQFENMGIRDGRIAQEHTSQLTNELGRAIARWSRPDCNNFHWIYCIDRHAKRGLTGFIAGSIPEKLILDVDDWIHTNFFSNRGISELQVTAAVRFRATQYVSQVDRSRRHWALVRMLAKSIDPECAVEVENSQVRLADLLQIPFRDNPAYVDAGISQSWRMSKSIAKGSQERQGLVRMGALKPFEDKAWSHLLRHFEYAEFNDRTIELRERQKAADQLVFKWREVEGARAQEICKHELQCLEQSWPRDARERRRSWLSIEHPPWWRNK